MSEQDLKLRKIIEDLGGKPESATPLFKQLSSVQLVELVVRIEEEYQIEISVVEYDPLQFESYDSIQKMIQNKTKGR